MRGFPPGEFSSLVRRCACKAEGEDERGALCGRILLSVIRGEMTLLTIRRAFGLVSKCVCSSLRRL